MVKDTSPSYDLDQGKATERTMKRPSIVTIRSDTARYWHVGHYFLTAFAASSGWNVRIRSRSWPGTELLLDDHFATEEEAIGWCTRMAAVYAEDQADD
jgi:hypothetical protein